MNKEIDVLALAKQGLLSASHRLDSSDKQLRLLAKEEVDKILGLIELYASPQPVAEVVLRKQTVGFGRTEERKDVMFLADVEVGQKLYAAPVRTKDLTDDEISRVWMLNGGGLAANCYHEFARAVIAADRELNR